MTSLTDKPTENAYLRDGALILYFDMAETPFISRFDLDSLAQANFEVADKKDGIYSLVLRDYTGQVQTIGQFSSKADAHNALHAILKALLSHNAQQPQSTVSCSGLWCFAKGVLKFLLAFMLFLFLLYGYVWFKTVPVKSDVNASAPIAQNAKPSPTVAAPEGEALDADEFLKQNMQQPVAAPKE